MSLFIHSNNVKVLCNPARLVPVVLNSHCKVHRDPGDQNAGNNAIARSVAPLIAFTTPIAIFSFIINVVLTDIKDDIVEGLDNTNVT